MLEIIELWKLAGGAMAYGMTGIENQIPITHGFGFVKLPPVSLRKLGRSWQLSDLGIYIRDFSMDPNQDLLVVVGSLEPIFFFWGDMDG